MVSAFDIVIGLWRKGLSPNISVRFIISFCLVRPVWFHLSYSIEIIPSQALLHHAHGSNQVLDASRYNGGGGTLIPFVTGRSW